jgi:hypothetical protein
MIFVGGVEGLIDIMVIISSSCESNPLHYTIYYL